MQLQEQVFWEASPEGMGIKQVPALGILGAGHDGVLFFFFLPYAPDFLWQYQPNSQTCAGGAGGGVARGVTGRLFSLRRCHSVILTKPLKLCVLQFLQLWNEQNSPSSSSSLLRKVKRRLSLHDEGLTVPFLKMQDFSFLSSLTTVIQVI